MTRWWEPDEEQEPGTQNTLFRTSNPHDILPGLVLSHHCGIVGPSEAKPPHPHTHTLRSCFLPLLNVQVWQKAAAWRLCAPFWSLCFMWALLQRARLWRTLCCPGCPQRAALFLSLSLSHSLSFSGGPPDLLAHFLTQEIELTPCPALGFSQSRAAVCYRVHSQLAELQLSFSSTGELFEIHWFRREGRSGVFGWRCLAACCHILWNGESNECFSPKCFFGAT